MAEAALIDDHIEDQPILEAPPSVVDTTDEADRSGAFPDDWREQMSGGDEKLLNQLKRFTSPQMLVKSWTDTRTKLSSGAYKTALAENPTEEQVAAWRSENGVPEAWDKYEIKLEDGVVLGEEDKPIADSFLQFAHEHNLPAKDVNVALQWYYNHMDEAHQEQYNADREFKEASIEALRNEWGPEFKANLNAIKAFLGDELGGVLFNARADSGERLGDHPQLLSWLAQTARDINPAATVVPGAGANSLQTIGDEIAKFEGMMGNKHSEYWKGPNAQANQDRYLKLLEVRQAMARRG